MLQIHLFPLLVTALQFLTSNDKARAAAKKEGRIEKPYLLSHHINYLTTKACHS